MRTTISSGPSNRASNQQDTGHDSLQNKKEREERIVGDENILRGGRRTKIKHHLQTYGHREKFLPQIEWRASFVCCLFAKETFPLLKVLLTSIREQLISASSIWDFQIGLGEP